MAKQALPNLVHGLVPLGIFYAALWLAGIWPAIVVSLAWAWGTIVVRMSRGREVPGTLVLGAAALTARTVVAMASDSVFLYFLQPTLAAAALAVAFLVSVAVGRPLATRVARDFISMPDWFASHPEVRLFFARMTVLWGVVQLANAGITAWLLFSQPVEVYLAAKTATTALVIGAAAAGSIVWFRRLVDAHGSTALASALAV